MQNWNRFHTIVAAVSMIAIAACATVDPPPPPDPIKEQITILQKQLLELQNVQNETKKKVDEQVSALEALSARVKGLEDRPAAPPAQAQIESRPTATTQADQVKKPAPAKKKPVKKQAKKKKTQPRRQGQ